MVPASKAARFNGTAVQFPAALAVTVCVWLCAAPVSVTVRAREEPASAVPLTGTLVTLPRLTYVGVATVGAAGGVVSTAVGPLRVLSAPCHCESEGVTV